VVVGARELDGPLDARARRSREAALTAAGRLLVAEGIDAVTHQRVAEAAGIGRRTVYRHWQQPEQLLHDAMARSGFPATKPTGDLQADLAAHLEALRSSLVEGSLRYVLLALNERAAMRPELRPLRDELTAQGVENARALLAGFMDAELLPRHLDLDWAVAALEGPLFYRVLVLDERVPPGAVAALVAGFLAAVR
jgi:AcrR family transcriptional regulator